MKNMKNVFNCDEEDFLCSRKGNYECLAKHLKRVEIIGYELIYLNQKICLPWLSFFLGMHLCWRSSLSRLDFPQNVDKNTLKLLICRNYLVWEKLCSAVEELPKMRRLCSIILSNCCSHRSIWKFEFLVDLVTRVSCPGHSTARFVFMHFWQWSYMKCDI